MAMTHTLQMIIEEAQHANGKYGAPTSTHEALGVLLEEFDELKAAIHMNKSSSIEHEAIQVASVAYRLALAIASCDLAFFDRSGLSKTRKVA